MADQSNSAHADAAAAATASAASFSTEEKAMRWRQKQKDNHKEAVATRAAEREAKLAAMTPAELAAFEADERAKSDQIYSEKMAQFARVDVAYESGLRVVLDLSFGNLMSDKEQRSLARQLSPCWGANRRAAAPVSLHLTSLGECPLNCLPKQGVEMAAWKVHRHDCDVGEAFSPDELVFLSPDAEEALSLPLDPKCVYVIGGLVDAKVQHDVTLNKARSLHARTARLPLAEHAPSGVSNPRLPLTLTAVLEILLGLNAGATWQEALATAIAPRHQHPGHVKHQRAAKVARTDAGSSERSARGHGHGEEDGERAVAEEEAVAQAVEASGDTAAAASATSRAFSVPPLGDGGDTAGAT